MPELNNKDPELKKKYTLEDFDAEVEEERQRQIRWAQALVDSKDVDEFEKLYPEEGREYREAGEIVFSAVKKYAVRDLENLKHESRLAFAAIVNNFTSYFPGGIYRRESFASKEEYIKKCSDLDEVLRSMGLDSDEVAGLFRVKDPSMQEKDRRVDIIKRAYVGMVNKGYANKDLKN